MTTNSGPGSSAPRVRPEMDSNIISFANESFVTLDVDIGHLELEYLLFQRLEDIQHDEEPEAQALEPPTLSSLENCIFVTLSMSALRVHQRTRPSMEIVSSRRNNGCLLLPERFLDEERRIVAGRVLMVGGPVMHDVEVAGLVRPVDGYDHGRFILHLDDATELIVGRRYAPGFQCIAIESVDLRRGRGLRRWFFREDQVRSQKGKWPSQGHSKSSIRATCDLCSRRALDCQCSEIILNRRLTTRKVSISSWTNFCEIISTQSKCPLMAFEITVRVVTGHEEILMYGQLSEGRDTSPSLHPQLIMRYLSIFPFRCLAECGMREYSLHKRAQERMCQANAPRSASRRQDNLLCQECGKQFATVGTLNRHMNMVHRKLKRHFCPICGIGFYAASDYRTHRRNVNCAKTIERRTLSLAQEIDWI